MTLAEVEYEHVKRVYIECDGSRSKAASILGIGERTLYNYLRKNSSILAEAKRRSEKLNDYRNVKPEERDDWHSRDRY